MWVLVIGAGFVGRPLCARLDAAGLEAVPVTLSGDRGSLACDVGDAAAVAALAREVGEVDAVVHCASSGRGGDRLARYRSVYLRGSEHLRSAFPTARLVFVSSSSVYGQEDGSWVDEGADTAPSTETGRVLLEAEKVVLDGGGQVARFAGIYGPGRSYLLRRYLEGAAQIDGDAADAAGRWINQIHREDAAGAVEHLLTSVPAPGIYNVADDRPLSQRECYLEFGRRFGGELPPVRPPDRKRARGWSDKRVSNAKMRGAGWELTYPCYFDALDSDADLVPSIEAQLRGGS